MSTDNIPSNPCDDGLRSVQCPGCLGKGCNWCNEGQQLRPAPETFNDTASTEWRRANQRTKNHVEGCDCADCRIVRGASETCEGPQAPIAKIRVLGASVFVELYAPGLPPGEHDVYLDPSAPGIPQLRALAKAPALETDEPQSQAALVSALTSWAERWAISTTRDDLDKGWSFAAQEVLEMIRKVIPQKAEVIERTNQGDSGCIMTGDTL